MTTNNCSTQLPNIQSKEPVNPAVFLVALTRKFSSSLYNGSLLRPVNIFATILLIITQVTNVTNAYAALIDSRTLSTTSTFLSSADAYVDASAADTNYGNSAELRINNSPIVRSFLRFDVQGLSGTVAKATLRIYATNGSPAGFTVNLTSDTRWNETSITFTNAPPLGAQVDSAGAFDADVWTTVDVTPFIAGNGTISLTLSGISDTPVSFVSSEGGANAPQLVITTNKVIANTPTVESSATPLPTQEYTATSVVIPPSPTKTTVLVTNLPSPTVTAPTPSSTSTTVALTPATALTTNLFPSAHSTASGSISGQSLNVLAVKDQFGTDNNAKAYMLFMTPGVIHESTLVFRLPTNVQTSTIQSMQININFMAPIDKRQKWSWSVYNWANLNWTPLGTSSRTDFWRKLKFMVSNPDQYVDTSGEIRVKLRSSNAGGDAKIDYEAIELTYKIADQANPTSTASPLSTQGLTQTTVPTSTPIYTSIPPTATSTPTNTATPTVPVSISGKDWYVDNAVLSSGDGTSWARAWKGFSNIQWSLVQQGDTVYLSGGNSSKTYNEQLSVSVSGTSTARITIAGGIDIGHNGQVIIDGGETRSYCALTKGNYLTLSSLTCQHAISSGIRIEGTGTILEKSLFSSISGQAVHLAGCDECIVRGNRITTDDSNSAQTDGIVIYGNSQRVVIESNWIKLTNQTGGHNDCIQADKDTDLTIRYNYCENTKNATANAQGIFATNMYGTVKYYGNIVVLPYGGQAVSNANLDIGTSHSVIINNVIKCGGYRCLYIDGDTSPIVKNNIVWQTGTGDVLLLSDKYSRGMSIANIPDANFDGNLWFAPGGDGKVFDAEGQKNWSSWQSEGFDAHGMNTNPGVDNCFRPTNNSPSINAGRLELYEYGLGLSMSLCGTSSSNEFLPVILTSRGAAWNIGAYDINNP